MVEFETQVEEVECQVLVERLWRLLVLVMVGTLVEKVECQVVVESLRRPLALVELGILFEELVEVVLQGIFWCQHDE